MLPYVSPDVGHSIAHEITDQEDGELALIELKKIHKSNPAIAEFISRWANQCKGRSNKIHAAYCGIFVYKLLESQAEVDEMETNA